MVDKFKSTDIMIQPNKEADLLTNPGVTKKEEVVSAPEVSAEVVTLKKQLADAEAKATEERTKRIEAEKVSEEANTKVVSTQSDALKAHESAINNAIEVAAANLVQIKRDLREALEGGDLDKQVELQEKLADARWQQKGAEQTKKQFDDWKEKQKTTPAAQPAKTQYTASEQAWIDAHPRFNTDDDYYEAVAGADSAARRRGIKPDTTAYYEYVEARLKKLGLEKDETDETEIDNGRDTTGSTEEVVVEPVKKAAKSSAVSAPVTNASPTTNGTKNTRQFKLTPEMQDMARKTFGPNSMYKLSDKDAEIKYAEWQMNIRDRRANGEKI